MLASPSPSSFVFAAGKRVLAVACGHRFALPHSLTHSRAAALEKQSISRESHSHRRPSHLVLSRRGADDEGSISSSETREIRMTISRFCMIPSPTPELLLHSRCGSGNRSTAREQRLRGREREKLLELECHKPLPPEILCRLIATQAAAAADSLEVRE